MHQDSMPPQPDSTRLAVQLFEEQIRKDPSGFRIPVDFRRTEPVVLRDSYQTAVPADQLVLRERFRKLLELLEIPGGSVGLLGYPYSDMSREDLQSCWTRCRLALEQAVRLSSFLGKQRPVTHVPEAGPSSKSRSHVDPLSFDSRPAETGLDFEVAAVAVDSAGSGCQTGQPVDSLEIEFGSEHLAAR
jgi:hypothetical protein